MGEGPGGHVNPLGNQPVDHFTTDALGPPEDAHVFPHPLKVTQLAPANVGQILILHAKCDTGCTPGGDMRREAGAHTLPAGIPGHD